MPLKKLVCNFCSRVLLPIASLLPTVVAKARCIGSLTSALGLNTEGGSGQGQARGLNTW